MLRLSQLVGCNALEGNLHRLDVALGVEVHAVDAHHAVVAVLIAEWVTVVDDIIFLAHAQHRVMAGTCGHAGILLQNHFEKAREKQRFYYLGKDGRIRFEVDIVPFGAIAEDDKVAWPPEGSPVMSVRCTKDVMRVADKVTVDGEFAFRLASLSGQFLIKLDTWADRRMKTKKDAADMAFLLQNVYVAYALKSDGLPPEVDINAEQFDVIVAGAEWMASDLRKMLTDEHRHFYTSMLRSELDKNEESPLLNDLLDISDSRYYYLYRRAIGRMAQILES